MNYDYIESLVRQSKDGDRNSKEKLLEEFKPFIINISKKTFIHGYEFEDIMNECYRILLKCISLYNIENHRFVAYATTGIKNSINDLIKSSVKKNNIYGSSTLTIDSFAENICKDNDPLIEDILCNKYDHECLKYAIKCLNEEDLELINHIFYKNLTLKSYADKKNICYSYAFKKKRRILSKLLSHIKSYIAFNTNKTKTSVC